VNQTRSSVAVALPGEAAQQRFWNEWNAKHRGAQYVAVDAPTLKRRETALQWVSELGLDRPRILDLGCATGWLSAELSQFGEVVGIDIADASVAEARRRYPQLQFECEDISNSHDRNGEFDVVVSLETLSHVPDQARFVKRIRSILKPGGFLILTTQNRLVFERHSGVTPRAEGQIRQWLSPQELRRLLADDFVLHRLTTFLPDGHLGFLRLLNSERVNRLLGRFLSQASLQRAKERLGLGQTIAVLAQRH
jgi:2-polyprenyl-3-methyl-5-hydroxy-6-metoxy-1,4-benzoquinol methylase